MAELLLELLSEEIPARMQARAAEDLKRLVTEKLKEVGLEFTTANAYATPRRLALVVDGLPLAQPDVTEEKRGPRVGAPEQAILGFLKGAGLTRLDQCEKRDTGKGEFWFAVVTKKGSLTVDVVGGLVVKAVVELAWPKSMRWDSVSTTWVRPLRRVLCRFDDAPVVLKLVHSAVDRGTVGHRFLAPGEIPVTAFADYKEKLRKAFVILDPAERRASIKEQASRLAAVEGLSIKSDEALLDEVTGLVEWPVVL